MLRGSVSLHERASKVNHTGGIDADAVRALREQLGKDGRTIRDVAREIGHAGDESLIYDILGGKRRCLRGKSHLIAVKLGVKASPTKPQADND